MPLFDYKCSVCNQTIELLENYSNNSDKDCIVCGGKNTAQRIKTLKTSFALTGSGWAKDNYSAVSRKKN